MITTIMLWILLVVGVSAILWIMFGFIPRPNSEQDEARIRGLTAAELPDLTDTQLIMLVLYRRHVADFDAGDALARELHRRATGKE